MNHELRILQGVSIHTYKKLLTRERIESIVESKRSTEKVGNILKVKRSN